MEKTSGSGIEILVDGCASKTSTLRRHQFLVSLCVCNLSDAVEITCIGYILGYLDGIALIDKEMLGASVIIGMLFGGIILGQLGDVLGRKTCLQASILTSAMAALASAFSPGVSALVAFRIIGGFGIGGVVPALYSLGAELFPKAKKSKMLTTIACCWILGSIYASVAGWIILGDDANGRRICPGLTWRAYAIVCAVPSFLAWLSTLLLIESPLFLIQRGKLELAAKSLSYMSHEEVSVEAISAHKGYFESEKSSNLRPIFRSPMRFPFFLLSVTWFCISFTGYGLMTWVATVFIELGYVNPFADACIINFSTLPGNLTAIFFVDKIGRREMVYWGMLFSGLSTLGFAIQTSNAALVLTCASLYGYFNSAGWSALFTVTADMYFPTKSRSSAVGLLSACGRVGGISAQFVFGYMQSNIPALLFVTSSLTLLGAFTAYFLPPAYEQPSSTNSHDKDSEIVSMDLYLEAGKSGRADLAVEY